MATTTQRRMSKILFYGVPINEVAERTGLSYQTIYKFSKGERRVTAENAVLLEGLIGIPRHVLRPDLWSPLPQGQRAQTIA